MNRTGRRRAMPDTLPTWLVPRFLSREEAAAYVGVSINTFDQEVSRGLWPRPLARGLKGRRLTWDRMALDAAADVASGLRAASGQSRKASRNTWDDL